jgi:hypothetical protein
MSKRDEANVEDGSSAISPTAEVVKGDHIGSTTVGEKPRVYWIGQGFTEDHQNKERQSTTSFDNGPKK